MANNSTNRHQLRKQLTTYKPKPFYENEDVTLYCDDFLVLVEYLPRVDAAIVDPPYGTTSLPWDVWPAGWPDKIAELCDQLWVFGSMKTFLTRNADFSDWTFAQDIVWEKHNGSSGAVGRFRRVHEHALHFYRGSWSDLYREMQYTHDATKRTVLRKKRPPHWGAIGDSTHTSKDGGPRQMRSVQYVRSCHGYAVNETQKPEGIVAPLVRYSVPPGGVVLDCFAGSGTTLAVALKEGRRAIGVEKRPEQCELIVKRLEGIADE